MRIKNLQTIPLLIQNIFMPTQLLKLFGYTRQGYFMKKELFQAIVDASVDVHHHLGGPGLLETVYESALCHELTLKGVRCQRQLPVPVLYRGVVVREPLFLDILIEGSLIIEVKATERDYPFYQAQLLTYLRMTGIRSGLLINFGKPHIKEAILQLFNNQAAINRDSLKPIL